MAAGPSRSAAVACTAVLCVAATLAAPTTAHAEPAAARAAHAERPKTLAQVQAEVNTLYHQAEVATESFNAAEEKVLTQQQNLVALAISLDGAQTRLSSLKDQAGAMARAQYRSGGMTDELRLALSSDPETFLNDASLAERGARAANDTIRDLKSTKAALDGYANAATAEWEALVETRRKSADAKREVETRLARAKTLLASLKEQERARLQRLEDETAYQAQLTWTRSEAAKNLAQLPKTAGDASAEGRRAVAFAAAQIGKPYVWGADGPSSYDCSGLTQQAWAAAGRSIPRTSQEQWRQLPHVPVDRMRPGDLIIYFDDASHVAMYIGDGAIVHAPRPGRNVTMAGAGSMRILGVVRPG
ncbi:NlpC/P60 family protein [Streptomyces sp. H10-C2]|uniref:C40 family peptidase n=1 Tax=unclassified Streptomyces TaxID=2593676 RepID=UPI0024BA05DA|nr:MULTISPECIES: NlpC/P60 family protein [unclassified Streptomyces]MDJ0346680.1 NlpC/P60 family protein [Streptomyces sp. PH10-H1]MDJ0373904.1 NlpC/P60 family protein [Streptomyces sp. H10-C2]